MTLTNQTIDAMESANYFGSDDANTTYLIRSIWTDKMAELGYPVGSEWDDWQQDDFDLAASNALTLAVESVG